MQSGTTLLIVIAIVLIAIVGLGLAIANLYTRATKSSAFVRTGLGGQKVILDGGAVILPVFQSLNWVNLQTLRLDVKREAREAMITRDRMRVDISVEFYVRVRPDASSIALAAQTLGNRTNEVEQLKVLVEAKFVDALRSVAATMALNELQERRMEFVQHVQNTVANDLQMNGMELESVSLTKLDQTETKFFNPDNAFDAEGLTTLTRLTEQRKRERNQIVRETEVTVAQQDLEATQRTLEIKRLARDAELNQQRDIAGKTAATRAEAAGREAEARLAEQSASIAADRAIAEARAIATRTQETARIVSEQAIAIAEQERTIAVAERSEKQSQATAAAEKARAIAVEAEQGVETARTVAQAERDRQVAVIQARRDADRAAASVTIAAEADKTAAANRAEAARVIATGEADAVRIRADAKEREYQVDAAGQGLVNEARNKLSPEIVAMDLTNARLEALPKALEVAVKPLEKIGEVRIIDMGGFAGYGSGGAPEGSAAAPMDGLVGQLMRYRAGVPIIDQLLKEAGFQGDNPISALTGAATSRGDGRAAS